MATPLRTAYYGGGQSAAPLYINFAQLTALASHTQSADGNTLTASSNGALLVDTGSPAPQDTVLYAPSTPSVESGVYMVVASGDGGHPWIIERIAGMRDGQSIGRGFVASIANGSIGPAQYLVDSSASPGRAEVVVGTNAMLSRAVGGGGDLPATTDGPSTPNTGAGSSHTHGITDPTHDHGGGTGVGQVNCQLTFVTPAAAGVEYHAPYDGGITPLFDGTGPWAVFVPARGVRVTGSAGAAACYVNIVGTDYFGGLIVATITFPGGAVTVEDPSARAFAAITQINTDVGIGIGETLTIETSPTLGVGECYVNFTQLGVDGVYEAPASSDTATGGVRPMTAPNGTRNYTVRYYRLHSHAIIADTADVTANAEASHTHSLSAHTHGITPL